MAKVKEEKKEVLKTSIDVSVVIAKYNANKSSETPKLDRLKLSKILNTHAQSFVNWNSGVTPNVLDSIFDMIVLFQNNGLKDDLIKNWQSSTPQTIVDQVIKMMEIGNCNIEDFVRRATRQIENHE